MCSFCIIPIEWARLKMCSFTTIPIDRARLKRSIRHQILIFIDFWTRNMGEHRGLVLGTIYKIRK